MPDVAAFDLDGTLTAGGSVFDYLVTLRGRSAVTAASVALGPRIARAALVGGTVADDTKERLFLRVLAGVEAERAEEVARRFAADHVDQNLRPEVFRRLAWHRRRGDHLAIVSASPEVYVRAIGDLLGVHTVIATRLEEEDGRLTGRYEGRNCRGEEKLRRLEAWVTGLEPPASRVWAYGNSRGDLRLLAAADVGVNVGRLGRLGRLSAFPPLGDPSPVDGSGPTAPS